MRNLETKEDMWHAAMHSISCISYFWRRDAHALEPGPSREPYARSRDKV